ncbi:ABC transporter ATP-binding protein [Methylocystis sp.]|uniref:ABC transporter ATP-binding protein n=1 Tax=Methylocystis sp. TaxID=1911079 RepID=UPI003DA3C5FD
MTLGASVVKETQVTTPALVALRAVGKTFPSGLVALSDYDLDVREGEFLTLLGPSGCGKSTVLRLIAGLANPTAGAIDWNAPQVKNNIGVVFQDATLLPWASVFDNVFLPLRLKGVAREAASPRIEEALTHVGLLNFSRALPRELSGGMRMRCAIARALVTRPTLMMMDEPFAALDEVTRFKLNDDLLALKRRFGATIVFVTHSVFEAAYLSTRIVVMSRRAGRIIDEIEIDPAIPRDDDYRSSKTFADVCRRASRALRVSIEEATP